MVSMTSAAVGAVWPELMSRFCRPGLDMFSKKDSAAARRREVDIFAFERRRERSISSKLRGEGGFWYKNSKLSKSRDPGSN